MNISRTAQAALAFAILCACGGGAGGSASSTTVPPVSPAQFSVTPAQKLRMEQLSSVFENNSIAFAYGYAQNINDGRGITCGRVGFTTGTGDWYQVVQAYTAQRPGNVLAPYLPRLKQLAAGPMPNPDTTGLDGMIAATATAGADPVMQQVQDSLVDSLIYTPAVQLTQGIGAGSALTVAAMYDGVLTHGQGTDPDSIEAMIARATQTAGGTPKTGVPESTWLKAFIAARRQDMLHPAYAPSTAPWTAAVGRLDVYDALIASNNWNLTGPIDTLSYGVTVP